MKTPLSCRLAIAAGLAALFALSGCSALPMQTGGPFAAAEPQPPYSIKWVHRMDPDTEYLYYGPVESAAVATDGERAFVGSSHGVFYAVDLGTGRELWRFETRGPVASWPLVTDGRVIFGDSDGMVYALRCDDGRLLWQYQIRGEILGRAAVANGTVFVPSSANNITALNLEDGAWRWMFERPLGKDFTIRGVSSPAVKDGVVYTGFADGYFVAVDAADGRERWKNNLQDEGRFRDVDAAPLIDGDRIFVSSYDGAFYCLSLGNGSIRWKVDAGGVGAPVLAGGAVYFSGTDSRFHAVDAANGEPLWTIDVTGEEYRARLAKVSPLASTPTAPLVVDDTVIFGTQSSYMYAVDRATGTIVWRFDTGAGLASAPIVYGDNVLFVSNGATLYCLQHRVVNPW